MGQGLNNGAHSRCSKSLDAEDGLTHFLYISPFLFCAYRIQGGWPDRAFPCLVDSWFGVVGRSAFRFSIHCIWWRTMFSRNRLTSDHIQLMCTMIQRDLQTHGHKRCVRRTGTTERSSAHEMCVTSMDVVVEVKICSFLPLFSLAVSGKNYRLRCWQQWPPRLCLTRHGRLGLLRGCFVSDKLPRNNVRISKYKTQCPYYRCCVSRPLPKRGAAKV